MIPRILFTLALISSAVNAGAADRFANVTINAVPVADGLYMLEGSGGNIGILTGKDGVLMVDSQYAPLSDRIKAAIAELGGQTPVYLLNTHYHGDHVGGNANFAGSLIIAHDNVRERMAANDDVATAALPALTYQQRVTLHFNGQEIQVIHQLSGHTDGDSIVFFTGSNALHLGDNLFNNRFPFVDIDGGGSVNGLITNIRAALQMASEDTKIIPGHGSLATKADLARYLAMLEATSMFVQQQIGKDKSLDEILAEGLPEKWDDWGKHFINEERWLRTLHRSFSS